MEVLEYYQLVRKRIWIVVLGVSAAVAVVVVYQLLPAFERQASGLVRVTEAGKRMLVYSAGELSSPSPREFWPTFEVQVESRAVLDGSATRAGLTGPDIQGRLKPLEAEQPTRGDVIRVTGSAPTAEQARALTQAAMEYISEYWNRQRIIEAEEVRRAIQNIDQRNQARLTAARRAVEHARSGGLSPSQELARAEGDLAVSLSQVEAARQEVAVTQERLRATETLAAEEASRPASARTLASPSEVALQARILELRAERAAELTRRTPDHPTARNLEAQIVELEKALEPSRGGEANAQPISPAVMDARVAVNEAKIRLSLVQQRSDDLRRALPGLRARGLEFDRAQLDLRRAEEQVGDTTDQLSMASTEIARLEAQLRLPVRAQDGQAQPRDGAASPEENPDGRDVQVLDDAEVLPSPKNLARFALLLVAAIIGGTVLSTLVVLALHYTSVAFVNEVEARAMLGARVLGALPRSDLSAQEAGPPIQVL